MLERQACRCFTNSAASRRLHADLDREFGGAADPVDTQQIGDSHRFARGLETDREANIMRARSQIRIEPFFIDLAAHVTKAAAQQSNQLAVGTPCVDGGKVATFEFAKEYFVVDHASRSNKDRTIMSS